MSPIITAISIATFLCLLLFAFYTFNKLVKRKALKHLNPILFPKGERQKSEIAHALKELTHGRFNDEQIIDYFIKIKGVHEVNLSLTPNFWVKRFLYRPTMIKLNYFEQVKFYNLFLNYPETEDASSPRINLQDNRSSSYQTPTSFIDPSMA